MICKNVANATTLILSVRAQERFQTTGQIISTKGRIAGADISRGQCNVTPTSGSIADG